MTRFQVSLVLAVLSAVIFPTSRALAQPGDASLPLALKGYDAVAYFTEKRARLGEARYQHRWDGALYQFASEKHLNLFRADPERYLPQYNNWCAASVSKGEKVYGNPEWWLVVDNRLYFFGRPIGPELMKADPAAMRSQADQKWPQVSPLPAPPVPSYMQAVRKQ